MRMTSSDIDGLEVFRKHLSAVCRMVKNIITILQQ